LFVCVFGGVCWVGCWCGGGGGGGWGVYSFSLSGNTAVSHSLLLHVSELKGLATNQVREETAKDNRQTAAWISHDNTT